MDDPNIHQFERASMKFNNDDLEATSKILFVIVLYKISLSDSLTYESLHKAISVLLLTSKLDLLICDNSPNQIGLVDDFENDCFNLYYLRDFSNPGISKSYNKAAEFAGIKEKEWLLVLDQDTILPLDCVYKYVKTVTKHSNYPIYTPKVFSEDLMLSPCRYHIYRGSPLSSLEAGDHELNGKNVINSGLLIALKAYIKVGGYDENVWLYFSDFVFFDRLKNHYKSFFVIDCKLNHELSSSDYSDYNFAISRFRYYCQGAKSAASSIGNIKAFVGFGVTVGLRSILMAHRFRNMTFIKLFFNSFFCKNENENFS